MTLDQPSRGEVPTAAAAIELERVRSAGRMATLRAVGTSAHAVFGLVFGGLLRMDVWRDAYLVAAIWALLAIAAVVVVRRSPSFALRSGILVPLLDVPALYALQSAMLRSASEPIVIVTMNLATMGLFIVGVSMSMRSWMIAVTTVVGAVAQCALVLETGADATMATSFVVVLGLFGAACAYSSRRVQALVTSTAEHGRALARAAEEEGKSFQELLDALPDGAVVSDGRTIGYANAKLGELVGMGSAQLDGRPVVGLVLEPERADLTAHLAAVEETGAGTIELHASRPDGRKVPVEMSSTRVALGGKPRIVSVVRDVTERHVMLDQVLLADRMASTGILAATIAHDINNPVTVVSGGIDFALEEIRRLFPHDPGGPVDEVVSALDDARNASQSVAAIVRELKIFARPDDGDESPVDVVGVLESTLRIVHNEVRARAGLVTELAPVAPVKGARSRLGQVFMNLVVNAAHAIPEGSPEEQRVTIRTRDEGTDVVIEVEDTGVGMSEEVRSRIFEPFFTTKPVGVGTGLGLPVCVRIVRSMGGRIEVSTTPGRGSCFRVILPASRIMPVSRVQPTRARVGPPARVLAIDDEPYVLDAIARVLRKTCEVSCAGSAHEALVRLEGGERFDVILCDLTMPGMTGADFHERLTRLCPELARRTAIVSGGAIAASAREYLEKTKLPVLAKPFEAAELRAFVSSRIAS